MLKRFTRKKMVGMGVIVLIVMVALMWVNHQLATVLEM